MTKVNHDNMLHAFATGLNRPRYATENNSVLTPTQARMIYALAHAGFTQTDIADQFGITKSTVRHVKRGESFSWITGHDAQAGQQAS